MTAWEALDRFLRTDPDDVGCDEALAVLHVYAELTQQGLQPELRFPGVAAHLRSCGPCEEDLQGLLAVLDEPAE